MPMLLMYSIGGMHCTNAPCLSTSTFFKSNKDMKGSFVDDCLHIHVFDVQRTSSKAPQIAYGTNKFSCKILQLCYRVACGTTLDGHWTPINIRLFFLLYLKQTKNELPAMVQLPVRQNLHFISDRVHSIRFASANISLAPNGILADGELLLRPPVVEWKCRHHPRYLRIAVDRPQ